VPTAREDDAERAVRAGLEIVDAVAALGAEVGIPELRARAGVVTGHAASMSRAGEGLVVGDRVNTAARIQSAADPGTVFVDGVTREATALAIAYEDGGEHAVKGKTEPLQLWHAQRVTGGLGGAGRERGLEAPLAGRDSSLRLLKELFHDGLAQRAARLVAITGDGDSVATRVYRAHNVFESPMKFEIDPHRKDCLLNGLDDIGLTMAKNEKIGSFEQKSRAARPWL